MIKKYPIVYITTSRCPSSNLMKFAKELMAIFPNSRHLNRGKNFLSKIVNLCINFKGTHIIMIHENRGNPDSFVISQLPQGPSVFFGIKNVFFLKQPKKINFFSSFPGLVINNLGSGLGKRLSGIFCSFFSSPSVNSRRIIILSGKENRILFRHHFLEKKGSYDKNLNLHEIGPSFDLYPYKITLGNLADENALVEWNLASFLNKSKKKSFLVTN